MSLILENSGIIAQPCDHNNAADYLIYLVDKQDGTKAIKKIHDDAIIHEPFIALKTKLTLEHLPAN